jgi:hypothetical protein
MHSQKVLERLATQRKEKKRNPRKQNEQREREREREREKRVDGRRAKIERDKKR